MINKELKEKVLNKSNYECSICGRTGVPLDLYHVKPISAGGLNTEENLRPICRSCNVAVERMDYNKDFNIKAKEAKEAYGLEKKVKDILRLYDFMVISDVTGPDAGVDLVVKSYDKIKKRSVTTLIECKSTSNISKEEINAFTEKCHDFNGDFGIMVTKLKQSKTPEIHNTEENIFVTTIDELNDLVSRFSKGSSNE